MHKPSDSKRQLSGKVFDIQHFSLHDGPGIRTTVFFKGCPLRCRWCHNPEAYVSSTQIMYRAAQCMSCGKCVAVCPEGCHSITEQGHLYDRSRCTGCGQCAQNCLCQSLTIAGCTMTVDEVMQQVREDIFLYEPSGGGLTLSGGEPMYQADFTLALAQVAYAEGISVCLETSGFCQPDELVRILPYIDTFLYDYKLTDRSQHKYYTGVDNDLIVENLRMIDNMGAVIVLRCPMIPQVNMNAAHTEGIAALARSLKHLKHIELEAYHNAGVSKREQLGMEHAEILTPPSPKEMLMMADQIQLLAGVECICV